MVKMNVTPEHERSHSSLELELEREFPRRLRQAIGDRSVLSFAKACGMSDSLVRKYLAGSLPGLDKAIIMARVAGVSLEWLAGGPEAGTYVAEAPRIYGQHKAPPPDLDLMEEVIMKTRKKFEEKEIDLTPEAEAKIIRLIYEFYMREGKPIDEASLNNVIELAAFR